MAEIEVLETDITELEVDAISNAAIEEAARIEVEEVRSHLADTTALERLVFAVRGGAAREAFERALER